MRHLLISREFPPAPAGGIGAYARRMADAMAGAGETVHVVTMAWRGAEPGMKSLHGGRLVVHRLAFLDWEAWPEWRPHGELPEEPRGLFGGVACPTEAFAWLAARKVEEIVQAESIDVIEAQEYEAPLYHFMLRRALGFGPEARPPVLIHLHSPSELIAPHNGENPLAPARVGDVRREAYCIGAADGLVCPSRFLARRAEAHYGLEPGSVEAIPLPVGEMREAARSDETWRDGPVLYVGRLEPRKGVIEWKRAAVRVANAFPGARFCFLGADVPDPARPERTVGDVLRARIPERLRDRFEFPGACSPDQVHAELARARMGVVPSRWENFPNTCVEMMASGLPVLATRSGGMAEMIEEGETGWLADRCSVDALADAARRALSTPPERLAAMGEAASRSARSLCGEKAVLAAHLEMRARLAAKGATRSLRVPPGLSGGRPRPRTVDSSHLSHSSHPDAAAPPAIEIVPVAADEFAAAFATARERIAASPFAPLGVVFLGDSYRPLPGFVEAMEGALAHAPDVGVVSCWVRRFDGLVWARPCPAYPHQWVRNDAAPCCAFRAEAIADVSEPFDAWELVNAVLADGWAAATLPEALAQCETDKAAQTLSPDAAALRRLRLQERAPDLARRDALAIARLCDAEDAWEVSDEVARLRARRSPLRRLARRARGWIGGRNG